MELTLPTPASTHDFAPDWKLSLEDDDSTLLDRSFKRVPNDVRKRIRAAAHSLDDGAKVVTLTSLDAPGILAHLQRLSEPELRQRFGSVPSSGQLAGYVCGINFSRDIVLGIVLGIVAPARVVALCHIAVFHEHDLPVGEMGISVDSSERGKGVGFRIMAAGLSKCALYKLIRLYIVHHRRNSAMAALRRRFSAAAETDGDEVSAVLEIHDPDESTRAVEHLTRYAHLELLESCPRNGRGSILLVHGAGGDAWQYRRNFMPFFAQHRFRVVAVSLRHHGQSTKDGAVALRTYVDDLLAVLDREDEDLVLVGHSLGGFIVQKALERRRFRSAVLLSSIPPAGIRGVRLEHATAAIQHALGRQVLADVLRDAEPVELHRISTPVSVVGGRHDRVVPVPWVEETACAYGTAAHVCERSGHLLMLSPDWKQVANLIMASAISPGHARAFRFGEPAPQI